MAEIDSPFEALLESARTGDKDALNTLLRQYERQVRGWLDQDCRRAASRGIDESGVVQDTLLCVARDFKSFRGVTEAEFVKSSRAATICNPLEQIQLSLADGRHPKFLR